MLRDWFAYYLDFACILKVSKVIQDFRIQKLQANAMIHELDDGFLHVLMTVTTGNALR